MVDRVGVPRALLVLGAIHALGAWIAWLDRYDVIAQATLTPGLAVAGLLGTWGLVLCWLLAITLVWALLGRLYRASSARTGRAVSPPVSTLGRHLQHGLLIVGLVTATVVVGLVFSSVDLMLWLVFGLWVLGFVAAGATLLTADHLAGGGRWIRENRAFATAELLAPTAALAWSMFVVFELLFHRYTGTFVLVADVTLMIKVMSDEAVAMVFGPSAPFFVGALSAYAAVAAIVCLGVMRLRRHRPPVLVGGRPLAVAASLGALGLALLFVLPTPSARAILHHIHPQGDDLGNWVAAPERPGDGPDATGRRAAQRLYPEFFTSAGERVSLPAPKAQTLAEYGALAREAPPGIRNVVVVFIDTVSRRNLDAWGYERPVAPHIKALADRSTRFDGGRTNGGTTDLATVSLFYGMRPFTAEEKTGSYLEGHGGLPFHLLAGSAGIQIGLFSGDWEVWHEGQAPVFPERCQRFLDARLAREDTLDEVNEWSGLREDRLVDELTGWLGEVQEREGRFLAYLKLFRPHAPYHTPETLPDGWRRPFSPQASDYTITDFNLQGERYTLVRNRYDNAIH
jgi:hypothetical protein